MVDRLAARLHTSPMRLLIGGWILAAVLLLGGLALILGGQTVAGTVVFLLGVVVSMTVSVNLLRLRAGEHAQKRPK
jgi:CHASE2 domain-containing sensor protein